jgi:hypothetical protein
MALKLLNPGLRPLGTFDLDNDDAGSLVGGEYVELQADSDGGADGYAADVGSVGPMGLTTAGSVDADRLLWNMGLATCDHTALGGLADEGEDEYGTLFGSLIGSNTGQATTQSGATVIGPPTNRGSGKVTVWHQSGLYGVNGTAATTGTGAGTAALSTIVTVNGPVHATAGGLLLNGGTTATGDQLGSYAGVVTDSSLVSTTNTAAGLAASIEYHVVYLFGPST